MSKMRVVIASSEAVPFIKTGGLADVAGSLPIYLKKLDVEVSVVQNTEILILRAVI